MKKALYVLLILGSSSFAGIIQGGYVGFGGGVANQIITFNQTTFGITQPAIQLSSPVVGLAVRGVLGYNVNQVVGLELGNTYSFSTAHPTPNNVGTLNTIANSTDGSLIIMIPSSYFGDLNAFGRIGMAYTSVNNTSSCNCGISSSADGSGVSDVLGAGIRYKLAYNWSIRAEWIGTGLFYPVALDAKSVNIGPWYQQQFLATIAYHF